jgi:hypothetical protein
LPVAVPLFLTTETAEDAELFQQFEIFSALGRARLGVLSGKTGLTTLKRDIGRGKK